MASLQASNFIVSSSSKQIHAAISVPKLPRIRLSPPKLQPKMLSEEVKTRDGFIHTVPKDVHRTPSVGETSSVSMAALQQLYAVLEAVADRVEMHQNIGEQRDNWNTLLLNSINMMTLTATTMAGVSAAIGGGAGVSLLGLKLASTALFLSATGMLALMNKIQPSQLVEEQRNATRLFKQLGNQIKTLVDVGSPTQDDVNNAMEKVLALDKAYPLPLLGVMLENSRKIYSLLFGGLCLHTKKSNSRERVKSNNGWTKELEMEMRQVVEVIKRKDSEDYERLGNKALKINKVLAKSGPLLTGIAALAMGSSHGAWGAIMAAGAGALASQLARWSTVDKWEWCSRCIGTTQGSLSLCKNRLNQRWTKVMWREEKTESCLK
ncbi:hypothetical protein V6N13_032637 [Hibiscus sabdariffa]